jgi:hypothetical protein
MPLPSPSDSQFLYIEVDYERSWVFGHYIKKVDRYHDLRRLTLVDKLGVVNEECERDLSQRIKQFGYMTSHEASA